MATRGPLRRASRDGIEAGSKKGAHQLTKLYARAIVEGWNVPPIERKRAVQYLADVIDSARPKRKKGDKAPRVPDVSVADGLTAAKALVAIDRLRLDAARLEFDQAGGDDATREFVVRYVNRPSGAAQEPMEDSE